MSEPEAETGALLVRMTERASKLPLAGRRVSVVQQDGRDPAKGGLALPTGSDGAARFAQVIAGKVLVVTSEDDSGRAAVVACGQETTVELEVDGPRSCEGCVVDPDGRPIAGAEVWERAFSWGQGVPRAERIGTSDGAGRFRGTLRSWQSQHLGARAPGRRSSAMIVPTVRGDESAASSYRIVLDAQGHGLVGTLTDARGSPIPGAFVTVGYPRRDRLDELPSGSPWLPLRLVTDELGSFAAHALPSGKTLVVAQAPGMAPRREVVTIPDDGDTTLAWTLSPGSSLSGTVTEAGGKTVAGARVVLGDCAGQCRVLTDRRGGFTLEDVPQGPATVAVMAEGYEYWERTVAVAGGAGTRCDAVLQPLVPIRGFVVDTRGAPVEGAHVRAWLRDAGSMDAGAAESDARGAFELRVPPGRRWRVALDDVEAEAEVEGGTSGVILVAPEQTSYLEAQVVDAGGTPLEGATLTACRGPGAVLALGSGRFRIGPALARPICFMVSPGGGKPGCTFGPFTPARGQTLDVGRLVLPSSGKIAFSVRRKDGGPIGLVQCYCWTGPGAMTYWLAWDPARPTVTEVTEGEYELRLDGIGIPDMNGYRFRVRAGETTEVALVLEPGRRMELRLPVPLPSGWSEVRQARVEWRTAAGELLYERDYGMEWGWEIEERLGLARGEYAVKIATDTKRAFTGKFVVDDLASDAPIEIAVIEKR